jgi:hypothetical protein
MDFTLDKITRGLLLALFSLIFINEYIEVPELTTWFILLSVSTLFVIWKEYSGFQKAKEGISYDFRLQQSKQESLRKSIIGYTILILIIATPFFVEFPFEKRPTLNNDYQFHFHIVFFLLGGIYFFLSPNYDYYYFGKRNITRIGSAAQTIRWSDVKAVETKKELDTFYITLKNDTKIAFEFKNAYYEWGWDKVMAYFEEQGVEIVTWQQPPGNQFTEKFKNWRF